MAGGNGAKGAGGAFLPKVSIIINTDARVKPLATCLESLRYLRYPNFEVVVVAGPTRDGTHELCAAWGDAIKFGDCPVRNLSQSRNISIAIASGDIVAFLDDDSVPEPEWLDDIIPAFQDPEVAVAGGFLHDHTGKTYQWQFGTADRMGAADTGWKRAAPEFNFPNSFSFPHVMANSAFRRTALIEVGGFDEEYEYFLDETDVICRFVDAGWKVAQLDTGFIHHKFMPSHIRNDSRVLTSWYSIVKNKAYFALRNARNHASVQTIIGDVQNQIVEFRGHVRWAIGKGMLAESDGARFEDEVERALQDGLAHGLEAARKLPPEGYLRGDKFPFVVFPPTLPAAQQRCYVFLTRTYPPASVGGIGRYIHQLARTLAAQGHQVHVLTAGDGHDRVDFEECVWVHRILPKTHEAPTAPELQGIPAHIWNYSRTMLDEAREIASRRKVEAVYTPIWDAEGIAFIGAPEFPLVTSLQTTLHFYLDTHADKQRDAAFMRDFVEPMLRMERLLFEKSDGIHAISDAIVRDIEAAYSIGFDRTRLWTVPLGLEDWTGDAPPRHSRDAGEGRPITICFVGRLESRKGVDVVMEMAPGLLRDHPEARLEFVGNDKLPGEDGRTWRERFEKQPGFEAIRDRVTFRGEVSDEGLRAAYRAADIVLAPSRFESFGLVHLEAAMYGKPVIGGRVGGMVEVIDDGVTGLLADPGDAGSLRAAVERLLADASLRLALGEAARQRYVERFTPQSMADGVAALIGEVAARPRTPTLEVAPALREPGTHDDVRQITHTRTGGGQLRIAVVGSVLAPFDAISNDLVRKVKALRETPGWQVTVFAGLNQRRDITAKVYGRMSEMMLDPDFVAADVIVYHFGIYYPLFDTLLLGNGRARQAVVFHNITPPQFAPASSRATIAKSFEQLWHLDNADAIWADSRENLETLEAHGIGAGKITIQPLTVDRPARRGLRGKNTDAIQVVYVGRIVPAKGLKDLVQAVGRLDTGAVRVKVKIVGDIDGADAAFREELFGLVRSLGLADTVEFTGAISDDERDALLTQSHVLAMPSYHEGFCVPVIEAMRAGMVPVVYTAGNLRYIADGLCVSAPAGDVAKFAAALSQAVMDVDASMRDPAAAKLRVDRGAMGIEEFERAVSAHVDSFEPGATARSLRELVRKLVQDPGPDRH
jgi:glycosyltransferase involved in cell wall biosynthesis/GT2 family glycosyltransferase